MVKPRSDDNAGRRGIDTEPGELRGVQVSALTAMRIIKHSTNIQPQIATGSLVGLDVNGILQVTNSFPFRPADVPTDITNASAQYEASMALAAAAPRSKSNVVYLKEMIKNFQQVNVDAHNAGWYTSASMGNFINSNLIENQFFYQREPNERAVALVYDTSRSAQVTLNLKAFRLSSAFMAAYKEGKFTVESIQKSNLRYQDILVELPITIHNSHFLTTLLHQLPAPPPTEELPFPTTLKQLQSNAPSIPPSLNFSNLDMMIDPFLEKTCTNLLEANEFYQTELNNYQYYQRSLAREQSNIAAWQVKRKSENAARAAAKQDPLPEYEWQRLFKLPTEPSRLETLINSRQIEQYARQIDRYTATITAKMFAVKGNLAPGDREG